MVDFAKAKGREIMSEPSPQLNSELLSQIMEAMATKEQAARDARRAAWRGLFGSLKKPLLITVWSAVWLGAGFVTRVWMDGGIEIGPGRNDVLSQSHAADRVSQVRILREYAGKSFPDEPTAQAWLNAQRIEARKTDWIPYTDELGAAADSGVDAVKALADKLENGK